MVSIFLRSWLALLVLCLLYMDDGVLCVNGTVCSEENMAIEGGHYTLRDGLNVDSMLTYHCPEGYYPYPDVNRRCQYTGNWFSPSRKRILSSRRSKTSECKVVECPEHDLEYGTVIPPQEKYFNFNTVNDTVTFECDSGYTQRGSPSRLCQTNGKWSGTTPVCGRPSGEHCPNPGIPAGATRVGNTFDIGSKITYSCKSKLTLIGSKERVCLESGQWTGSEPKCYYQYTFDTAQEIAEAFTATIGRNLKTLAEEGLEDDIQKGKKLDVSKDELLNIYIAVDVSASIKEIDFIQARNSVEKLLIKISSYDVSPNYEIFFFDTGIKHVSNITEKKKLKDIIDDLKKVKYEGPTKHSGTNMAHAFKHLYQQITFLQQQAKRKDNLKSFEDLSHVIIIFTDGGFNVGGDPQAWVQGIKDKVYGKDKTREKHLDIYIFAVGETIYHEGIKDLATQRPKEQHYFTLNKGDNLEKYFDSILDEGNSVGLCGLYYDMETEVKSRRYPWLAKIAVTNSKRGACLGSLVAPKFILTAAHCFRFGDTAEHVQVEISDGTKNEGKVRKVERLIPHPQYDVAAKVDQNIKEYYDFDVALIELKTEVEYTAYIRPICIPCTKATSGALKLVGSVTCQQQEEMIFQTQEKEVAFMTEERGTFHRKRASVQLLDRRDGCIKHATHAPGVNTTNPKDAVSDNFLCTGGHDPFRNHLACTGDSGGAVFIENEYRTIQVGVVSWGTDDVCTSSNPLPLSGEDARDFHINLFKVVPFLKKYLGGDANSNHTALEFLH